mgnify:CR=1 FL=1
MRVILRTEIPGLGKLGDVKQVADGYARNYLIPRGMAYKATPGNMKALDVDRRREAQRLTKELAEAQEFAAKIAGVSVTISVQAGEEDKLFGSVTSADIADALAAENVTIDRRKIDLPDPIRELGVFNVPVKLHRDVDCEVRVWVVKE